MRSGIASLLTFALLTASVQSAFATKPCNNLACSSPLGSGNRIKCLEKAEIIFIGSIENLKENDQIEESFSIKVDKLEKGNLDLLRGRNFRTGCYIGSDLSAQLPNHRQNKSAKFRFYLAKSDAEHSGFKVIEYESLSNSSK